jgi:uncharacterized membrane protein
MAAQVPATLRQRFVKFRSGYGFIVLLSAIVGGWIVWNSWPWPLRFDEPPFVLLNLLLSIEAAFAMPVLLMEQFKHEAEDRALLRAGLAADRDIAAQVRTILKTLDEMEQEETGGRPGEPGDH